jgi:glycosyltransferase involved in cell wall biosynthesis
MVPTLPDVVCLSTADWDAPLWTNKQHLMSRLAASGGRVIYIDSPGHRAPTVSKRDLGRMVHRLHVWRPYARPIAPQLWRDSPLLVPFHDRPVTASINRRLLRRRLNRNLNRTKFQRPVLWAYSPLAVDLYDPERHSGLVYHCVDKVADFPGVHSTAYLKGERRLVEAADVCLASSRVIERHLQQMGARDVVYWPNPADVSAICAHPAEARRQARPVVGFIGAVQSHKIDVELIKFAASQMPETDFLVAGPIGYGISGHHIDGRHFPNNVTFPGLVSRRDVPAFLAQLDVGIIPYLINDYTSGVFPMKVFEYLAAGLPVVGTELPSLVGEVREVAYAPTPEAFVESLRSALEDRSEQSRRRRIGYAQAHSWERRIDEAASLLGRFAPTPDFTPLSSIRPLATCQTRNG